MASPPWERVLPEHEVFSFLREVPGSRVVLRTRFRGQDAVTRLVLTRVSRKFAPIARELALRGRGTAAGMPEDALLVLEGYRAAALVRGMGGIAHVLDAGVAVPEGAGDEVRDGPLYVTTRWIPGLSLAEAWPGLQPPERTWVLQQVLEVLAHLHAHRVAFGDLKPSNLVLSPGDRAAGVPGGVWFIDCETMREVPDSMGFAVTRDLTRVYAAPEQQHDHTTFLSSDVYAFAVMVTRLLGGGGEGLPAPWDRIIPPCLRLQPLRRPVTPNLWRASRGEPIPLACWDGSTDAFVGFGTLAETPEPACEVPRDLPSENTIRVPEPVSASWEEPEEEPEPAPAPAGLDAPGVPPDLAGLDAPGVPPAPAGLDAPEVPPDPLPPPPGLDALLPPPPVAPAPGPAVPSTRTPPRGKPRHRVRLGFAALAVLVATGLSARLAWTLHQQGEADALAGAVWDGLRQHKTVPQLNSTGELDRLVEVAGQAVTLAETPRSLGVLALASVWQQRWHFSGARWNAEKMARGRALVDTALEAGETVEARFARALLDSAACRLMPDRQVSEREPWCLEMEADLALAEGLLPDGPEQDWFRLEMDWLAVMTWSGQAVRLRNGVRDAEADVATGKAFDRCAAGLVRVPAAPVNGVELLEDCLTVAGAREEYGTWLAWTSVLLDEVTRTGERATRTEIARIFRSAHLKCATEDVDARGAITVTRLEATDPATFCAYMGRVAVGCSSRAWAQLPYALRLAEVFGTRPTDDAVPWGKGLEAARSASRPECLIPDL